MKAKKVCPFWACPHNVLFQIFDVNAEPVVTDWVRENGACMCDITPEEEKDGVAGMRNPATLEQIAEVYGVRLYSVQFGEKRGLKKIEKKLRLG